jgi:phenylacetate-CoA ligase
MFVQPSQLNKVLENLNFKNNKARMIISRSNDRDELHIKIETNVTETSEIKNIQEKIISEVKNIINLRGTVEIVSVNSLPNDGKVIDDTRDFGE